MAQTSGSGERAERVRSWVAALGLAMSVALLALPPPEGMPMAAKQVAAVGILMAALWISEIVPLAAAALVPLATFPLAAIATFERTAQSYADPLIFLFMGGFMLSAAIERWGLHRRVARLAVAVSGRRPDALMLAMMGATAFLSLWVSNTASAMVMVPMAGALAGTGDGGRRADGNEAFRAALLLAIAYSATIGGIGSLIGTPPNAMLAAYMHKSHGLTIGFGQWMLIGVPIVLVLLPVVWLLLTRFAFRLPAELPPDAIALSRSSLSRPQRLVAGVLVATAAAWIARPFLAKATGWTGLHDAGIAIVAVLVLFGMPQRWSGAPALLEWKDVEGIRWDVLILFGGGLALADGVASTGLAAWIGGQLQHIGGMPVLLMVLVMMIVVVYLGELASNTAVAAIFLPVAGAAATGLGARPIEVVLPIALAASLGFMLPVATPPNAIAYGTGAIPAKEMLKAGAALDVVSILIVFALATVLVPLVFPAP